MSPSTDKSAKNYAMAWRVFSAMNDIYESILSDDDICAKIDQEVTFPQPNGEDMEIEQKILSLFFMDLIKCYQNSGHPIDLNSDDAFLLKLCINLNMKLDMENYDDFICTSETEQYKVLYVELVRSFEQWCKSDGKELVISRFVKDIDEFTNDEYKSYLLSASNFIRYAGKGDAVQECKWLAFLRRA